MATLFEAVAALLDDLGKVKAQIEQTVPNSRERSLALTKVDEAALWLGALAVSAAGKPGSSPEST